MASKTKKNPMLFLVIWSWLGAKVGYVYHLLLQGNSETNALRFFPRFLFTLLLYWVHVNIRISSTDDSTNFNNNSTNSLVVHSKLESQIKVSIAFCKARCNRELFHRSNTLSHVIFFSNNWSNQFHQTLK